MRKVDSLESQRGKRKPNKGGSRGDMPGNLPVFARKDGLKRTVAAIAGSGRMGGEVKESKKRKKKKKGGIFSQEGENTGRGQQVTYGDGQEDTNHPMLS